MQAVLGHKGMKSARLQEHKGMSVQGHESTRVYGNVSTRVQEHKGMRVPGPKSTDAGA